MNDTPTHRTAIVTGGSRGIGRGIAEALGAAGHNVVINYNSNADAAQQAADAVKAAGGDALIVQADIGQSDDRKRLVDEAIARFGRIDLLVNNAGVGPKVRADLMDMAEESWDWVLDVNLKGPFFLTQLVANRMIEQGEADQPPEAPPAIVNIGSISAYTASINRGEYCIAKAGIGMMTSLFADRLAPHGINVYEVRPGIIATDMTSGVKAKYDKLILEDGITPIRRWGKPDDIAKAVVAIATGLLPFSTGEVINVDGGFHMKRL
ncbi:3-ketoacyl-ACP reductase [Phycisphaerales bacterium AB-hyl4]|uniref:3-ketoacyl-ACP reductase n=1 Tax=Natronomicrosphaera hydrolytica TaxID=3242702 RepID=A0ABV4U2N0_9BACT